MPNDAVGQKAQDAVLAAVSKAAADITVIAEKEGQALENRVLYPVSLFYSCPLGCICLQLLPRSELCRVQHAIGQDVRGQFAPPAGAKIEV